MTTKRQISLLGILPTKYLPAVIGGEKSHFYFYNYLSQAVKLELVISKSNKVSIKLPYKTFRYIGTIKLKYFDWTLFFKIRKIIRRDEITHFIIEQPFLGWLGFLLKKFTDAKFIVHTHNIEALRFKRTNSWFWKILWCYESRILKAADIVFFISDEDRLFAIKHYDLNPQYCTTITFGTPLNELPKKQLKENAKQAVRSKYGISESELLLLFNGNFNYGPNLKALSYVEQEINSRLTHTDLKYKIIICGKDLSKNFKREHYPNIIFAGFVEDIDQIVLASDIFLNPLIEGGGIKTKLVEALSFGTKAVSTASGAYGVPVAFTGGRLRVVQDYDWSEFVAAIVQLSHESIENDHAKFYDMFYWPRIIEEVVKTL
ncbi:MAG: glycosyltransferase family 4 protein [Phycisphaerales bacterium]|nr:glycosyltransferase family 4 protein [Phycisphaerales bacterium]